MNAKLSLSILICGTLLLSCKPEPMEPVGAEFDWSRISLQGGRERIVCEWDSLPEDIVLLRLSFSGDYDGIVDIPVQKGFCEKEIAGLPEGTLKVQRSCIDTEGEIISSEESLDIRVYGPRYESGLPQTASISGTIHGAVADLKVSGNESVAEKGFLGNYLNYTNCRGEAVSMEVANKSIVLEDVASDIVVRGMFLPQADCCDMFYGKADTLRNTCIRKPSVLNATIDGYRGIWFDLGQAASDYGSKYSGGLGTYTMKHIPMAIYAPAVDRTYFVYGGTLSATKKYLLCMIGCYDHRTGLLQKPRVVMDKGALGVIDPHDDPTVQIDRDGYVWVFVSGRGNVRYGKRYRSVNPYDITAFELINESIMAYPQVMYEKEKGFFLFFTRYDGVRQLFYQTSPDGVEWSDYKQLAHIREGSESKSGHYQISNICGSKLCTAFNRHINGNVDTRTNIYYLQSTDWGETWTTADLKPVSVPVTTWNSNCLVRDYQHTTETHNCYIKDLNFDSEGNPVILYLTSKNHLTGPNGGIRQWHVIHWTGSEWEESLVTQSRHCYDSGSLWIEGDIWYIIAPTDPGPTYWGAGGEVVRWKSTDKGRSWVRDLTLTKDSPANHTYMRRPWGADDGFYSFWADGDPDKFTQSNLYFCDKQGQVFRMPYEDRSEWMTPVKITYTK